MAENSIFFFWLISLGFSPEVYKVRHVCPKQLVMPVIIDIVISWLPWQMQKSMPMTPSFDILPAHPGQKLIFRDVKIQQGLQIFAENSIFGEKFGIFAALKVFLCFAFYLALFSVNRIWVSAAEVLFCFTCIAVLICPSTSFSE